MPRYGYQEGEVVTMFEDIGGDDYVVAEDYDTAVLLWRRRLEQEVKHCRDQLQASQDKLAEFNEIFHDT